MFFYVGSFAKSNKERFALSLFTKRATKSDSLFHSLPEERQRANRSFAILKRAPKSKSLFCSFKKSAKEGIALSLLSKRANRSFALFFTLFSKKKRDSLFCKKSDCPTLTQIHECAPTLVIWVCLAAVWRMLRFCYKLIHKTAITEKIIPSLSQI